MKLKLFTALATLVAIFLTSCKKQEIQISPLASLQVTNVVIGGATLQFGTNVPTIADNSTSAYGIMTGNLQLKFISTEDPHTVYYDQTANFTDGDVYSLFLTGTPTAVESVMIKENDILFHTDNAFGIRVINLSPGSDPISVNMENQVNGSLMSSVAYKAITEFKTVSAKAEEGAKVFEFRNAQTGALITTFTIPDYDLPRYRNITLVFAGAIANEVIVRANNY